MAKEIIWTENALKDRFKIFKFWIKHNKSDTYSKKLDLLFEQKIDLLAGFPEIGLKTDYKQINVTFVNHFAIFFKLISDNLIVLRIYDTRRNPDKIKF